MRAYDALAIEIKGILSRAAALRLAASPRRSYRAVVAMLACPASSATVAKSAPAASRVLMKVRRRSCGLKVATLACAALTLSIQVTALSVRRRASSRPRLLIGTNKDLQEGSYDHTP
jgi:hypothetical protein